MKDIKSRLDNILGIRLYIIMKSGTPTVNDLFFRIRSQELKSLRDVANVGGSPNLWEQVRFKKYSI